MSGVDSEQDKQPISSVNGQSGDNDIVSPGKEGPEDDSQSATEGLKGTLETDTTAVVSSHSEEAQSSKEGVNEGETKDSQSPEITNGEIAEGHENKKVVESSAVENKPDETQEVLDSKQVNDGVETANIENEMVEAGKEVEEAVEQSEPEKSNDPVTAVADGEQNKVETEPVEVETTVGELKEGAEVDEKQSEEKCENQPSEESKVAVTDPEAVDRKRAVTIDNPVDMNELTAKSGQSPRKAEDVHDRSRTLGDIEGKASSPLKEDVAARSRTIWYTDEVEDAPSKPDSTATEETVSYSTSIVGGVVHRVPISSSPKTQHKPKEGSPQLSPSKPRSVIDSLFGRNKKSKGSPESPQRSSAGVKDAEKESQQNLPESTPVAQDAVADAAKDDTEPSESGASAEVEDAKSTDAEQETEVKAATEKEGGDGEIQPAPVAQSEEGNKEERTEMTQGSEEKEGEVESQEVSVPVEGAEEKGETSAETPEGEQPEETKDAVKRAHSDLPEEEETSPQPAAKKKKPIFGGIFTRRKSKKTKSDLGSPPAETVQEKEGGKADEEQQGESMSTKPADDAKPQAVEEVETVENGTGQRVSSDTSQTTATAQQEVTEDVISPATDQGVESVKEEIADEGEQEVQTAAGGEPSGKEEDTVMTEDVQKSAEESLQSTDADGAVEKEETEQQPVHSQDNQPEKKHSIFSGFFGRRKSKKSKEVDAASSAEAPQEKSDDVEEQQNGGNEPAQPADDTKPQAVDSVETSENGTDKDAAPETSDTTAAVQQEVAEDAISPAVDQAVESAKEEILDKEKVDGNIGEQEGEAAVGGEPSGKEEETVGPEGAQESAEEPLQSEDADDTVEKKETEGVPVQSQESQPEKKYSIFSGLFARRKSKKSKGDVSSTPGEKAHEKEGDEVVEEQQAGSASTQSADDATPQALESEQKLDSAGTDQDASASNTSDTTATVQQEVTEDVISPAVDQPVESGKDEIADKVDGNIGEQETTSGQESSSGKEVETPGPEDVNKSTEEESEIANDKPRIEEPSEDTTKETSDSNKPVAEKASSSEPEEAQDRADTALKERIALTHGSHSPKTRRMQMRISYAETNGEGGREVEVIGTPERVSEATNQKGKTPPDHRVSCRDLGEADHEGWLAKKGGPLFFSSWKRKWVVSKEGKLYYFKTAFDPEASGVINMEGLTVAQAPETKKNFCFKCEQPGPKPRVSFFMADSKEDMEKWLTVLAAASKGEVIQKTKQHHLTPRDEVVMRKKSGSISAQRTSSVLAVGGRHDFLEDEEDLKVTRRRSTPGSLSKSPEETEEKDKRTSVSSGTHPVISETHPEPDDTQPVPSDTQEVSEPSEDKPEETSKSSESETTEKPVSVVDEVLVSSEKIAVESVPVIEVPAQQDTPAVESFGDSVPVVASSHKEEEGSEGPANVSVEATTEAESAQPEQESAPGVSDSTVDKTDGVVSIVTTESSVTVETVKTTSVISEKVETVVSVVKTEVTEVSSSQQPSETGESKQDAKEDSKETSQTQLDEPLSPSKTKWYFTLDRQETWSVPPEVEEEKSSSRPKSPGSSSDKVSIKSDRGSIKSDKGSIKSSSDDDDLLVMCQNIRKARLSIVGDPMWDGPERLRALSSVHDGNEEAFVRLKTLERTLKDKEKHLSELEELLTQPEINRDSIYAWKLRYSDLVEELFPQDDGDTQEEVKKAAEGGESETQDQESSKAGKEDGELKSSEGSEKEVKEETAEEVAKKSDEELATSFKEEDEGKVDDKQAADEEKEETERDQETVKEEQPSSEKQEDSEQKEDDNLIVTVEIQQIPAESVSVTDSEQSIQETGIEHEKQAQEEETVPSSEQRPSDSLQEESGEQEDSEDVQNTRL